MDDLNASQMSCLWCTDSEGMKSRLLEYCQEPPWADIVSRDFSFCQYCVTEYHEAKNEFLLQNKEKEEILTQIEINRLRKDFNSALNNSDLDPTELEDRLQVPIFEVLKYPYLLLSKEMDNVFCKAISTLQDSGHPPTVSELLPGLYLLFIHSQVKVRQWAKEAAKSILPIKAEEYEEIQLIVTWMLNVIDFDLFETPNMADMMEISSHSDCVLLPSHLFCSDSVRDYWQGVKMLLTSLDQGAVRNKLMRPNGQGGHRTLVDAVIFVMEKSTDVENCENSAFWPALECFILLLEKLEFRMWQYLSMSPDEVLKLITTHAVYLRQLQKLDNCKSQKAETDQCVPKESQDPQKKRNKLSLKKRSTSKTSSPRSSNSRGTVSDQFKRISVEDENLCSGFEDKLSQDSQREERLTVVFACFLPYINSLLEFGCLATKTVSSTMKFLVQQAEHVFLSTEGTVSSPASSSKYAMDNSGATCHNRYQDIKNCAVCEQCITVLTKLLELLFTKKQYALTVPNASVWVQAILDYVKLMEKGKRLPDESTSKPSLKCHLQKKCEDLVLGLLKAG
ncbi:probable helicase senataxin [Ptychodera flava]|uniref:probable helicase senataxin n=1 Tax=Ptychodera flava TaxID=63121 RepID=UPI003969D53F